MIEALNSARYDLLRALGPSYLTDLIAAAAERRLRAEAWQSYHADCLRLICTALGAKDLPRFRDLMHPAPADPRPGLEIAEDWLARHGCVAAIEKR